MAPKLPPAMCKLSLVGVIETYDSFELNDFGELILGNYIVDDGEDVEWV